MLDGSGNLARQWLPIGQIYEVLPAVLKKLTSGLIQSICQENGREELS